MFKMWILKIINRIDTIIDLIIIIVSALIFEFATPLLAGVSQIGPLSLAQASKFIGGLFALSIGNLLFLIFR
jgi:hypothetical protein